MLTPPLADVIVVGAGPAGATAAAHLAKRGHGVTLVDRASFPRPKPCGDYCNPGATRLLTELGGLPDVVSSGGGVIDAMTVVAPDGSSFTERFPTGHGVLIRRERLDEVLLRRAASCGAEIVENFNVDDIRIDGHVEVRDRRRGLAFRGCLVIAADGMRSIVSRRLGLMTWLPDGRYTVGAYFSGFTGPAAGELHLGADCYGGVARFGDGTANVCLALPRKWFPGRSAAGAFAHGIRHLPNLRERLPQWKREGSFRVCGPVGITSHPVVADRTILAGDAAGQVEPITGQGISFALQTGLLAAEEAGKALDAREFSARALGGYARSRSRILGPKLRLMNAVTGLALHSRLTPALIRRLRASPGLSRRLLGSTGDILPPADVFSGTFALRLLLGIDAHEA